MYVKKVSSLKLYRPRQKWTINESLIFSKIVLLAFYTFVTYPGTRYRKYTTKTFKCIEIPKYKIHEIGSGTKLFITFELKVIRHEERERDTIFLCWLLLHRQLSTQPTRGARSAQIRMASPRSESQPSRSDAGTQLTDFSLTPKNPQPTLPVHDVIHTP